MRVLHNIPRLMFSASRHVFVLTLLVSLLVSFQIAGGLCLESVCDTIWWKNHIRRSMRSLPTRTHQSWYSHYIWSPIGNAIPLFELCISPRTSPCSCRNKSEAIIRALKLYAHLINCKCHLFVKGDKVFIVIDDIICAKELIASSQTYQRSLAGWKWKRHGGEGTHVHMVQQCKHGATVGTRIEHMSLQL